MSGRLYERIITGRCGPERNGGRRGARDIDVAVANHRSSDRIPSVGSVRPTRIF
ncbi:hypothetical protein BH10ACT1_BH10ACT1_26710 [soil metagenome]